MRILILADPLDTLLPKSDTGLTLLREGLRRGHEMHWATPGGLGLKNTEVWVSGEKVAQCEPGEAAQVEAPVHGPALDFDAIYVRKDPPFDAGYVNLCWLLSLVESKVWVRNRPHQLLRHHEKLIPYQVVSEGDLPDSFLVPTYMNVEAPNPAPGPWVTKPWLGHGGEEVDKWSSYEEARGGAGALTMVQPFEERVSEGDRRVFFVDGEFVGDFVRVPAPGGYLSNLSQGGSAQMRKLTAAELEMCEGLGRFLKRHGILFAGADFLADKLSEVNITAPTGLEKLKELGGAALESLIFDVMEREVGN